MLRIELINTGSELLLGRTLNLHQQWICRQLADRGYFVARQVTVPDTSAAITEALGDALQRADYVLTTGGLGPTADDLTREKVAALLERELVIHPPALEHIRQFFSDRKRAMPDQVTVQAMVPQGAEVWLNAYGTAPGLALTLDPNPLRPSRQCSRVILLPGPPRELRPMFTHQFLPFLLKHSPLETPFACRTLLSTGIGESMVEARLAPSLRPLQEQGLQVGYCARPGEVDVRLLATGPSALALVADAETLVRHNLKEAVYGEEETTLAQAVLDLLIARRETVAVAESCTGGEIAARLTDVPGSSAAFVGGWIVYSNELKHQELGVPRELLVSHGAVSEPVARAMAEGARRHSGADYALAVTGIAGPDGGTKEKPVGTVFIALASSRHTWVLNPVNAWDRRTFKQVTTQQALNLLRRGVLGTPGEGGRLP